MYDAQQRKGQQSYTILLIVTDGAVSDPQRTAQALDRACDAPLSVVIVGVGNANFSSMQFLDDYNKNNDWRSEQDNRRNNYQSEQDQDNYRYDQHNKVDSLRMIKEKEIQKIQSSVDSLREVREKQIIKMKDSLREAKEKLEQKIEKLNDNSSTPREAYIRNGKQDYTFVMHI